MKLYLSILVFRPMVRTQASYVIEKSKADFTLKKYSSTTFVANVADPTPLWPKTVKNMVKSWFPSQRKNLYYCTKWIFQTKKSYLIWFVLYLSIIKNATWKIQLFVLVKGNPFFYHQSPRLYLHIERQSFVLKDKAFI